MISLCWSTRSGLPSLSTVAALVLVFGVLTLTAPIVEISVYRIVGAMLPALQYLSHLLVTPDWDYLPQLGKKMLETVEMTLLGTAVATALSFPMGILAARNASPNPIVFFLFRNLLSLVRALPELVWALVFISAVGLGPLAGVMAIALVTVGFMGKFIAESIEVVDNKAIEGVKATGARHSQIIRYAMFPQAVPDFIGTLLYILDHNLRAAAILGMVGAGGIGYDMVMSMRLFQYNRIIMIIVSIYVLVTLLDRLSNNLRRRAIGKTFIG
ncbi:MAG TPA: phosphonate ABC transporter, permease protein PhnE [Rhodospirillales bacterium]|nr:phosphonate ABC transporter, permease protein PhnE [Rhodospirillales bacterium]